MALFTFSFTVDAPLAAVSAFHHDTRALNKLTPPPVFVQIHELEPLAEGSRAEFTMWFGPVPIRWVAVHSQVSENGFTDTQQQGPLKFWRHRHQFTAVAPDQTHVQEQIEYCHHGGWRGLFSRLLFNKPGLYLLFSARKLITRWYITHKLSATPAEQA